MMESSSLSKVEKPPLSRAESVKSLTDATGHLLPQPDDGEPRKEVKYKPKDGPRTSEDTELELFIIGPKHKLGCAKYGPALRCLVPYRCQDETPEYSRLDNIGCLNFMMYSWLTTLMWKAYRKGLTVHDMWKTSRFDSCELNTDRLQRIWKRELRVKGEKDASFFRACWKFCKVRIIVSAGLYAVCLGIGFLVPTIFVNKLINIADPNLRKSDIASLSATEFGILLVFGLTCCEVGRAILFVTVWAMVYRTSIRLRAACMGIIYRKILELKNLPQAGSSNDIVNIITSDVARIFDAIRQCVLVIGGPLLMIAGAAYSVYLLSWIALVGASILILFYPVQILLSRVLGRLRRKGAAGTDQRISLITELINSIRLIKMYAWEEAFCAKVTKMRDEELKEVKMTAWLQSVNLSLTPLVPVLTAVVTFLSHMGMGNKLDASEAFTLLTIFYSARSAYNGMPFALRAYAEIMPSCHRIQAFTYYIIAYIIGAGGLRQIVISWIPITHMKIACERIQKFIQIKPVVRKIHRTKDPSMAMLLESVSFSWSAFDIEAINPITIIPQKHSHSHGPVLRDISLDVKKGTLIGLCGPVGCGKSSLFHGMLGQIYSNGGTFQMRGQIAYVPQQAWLINATVRENICFGEPYIPERYTEVVSVCNLSYDFTILPGGDQCVIGERGSTMSGGQRQRINLARAVYSNRDILLLDDPLSAVDARVGAAIFEKCIYGYLRQKGMTVFLISGQIQYLEKCDQILVLKSGAVVQRGTHGQLLKEEKSVYWEMVQAMKKARKGMEDAAAKTSQPTTITPAPAALIEEEQKAVGTSDAEEQGKGTIKFATYKRYIKAAGPYWFTGLVFFAFAFNMALNTFSGWWLSFWLKSTAIKENVTNSDGTVQVHSYIVLQAENAWYPIVYGSIILVVIIIFVIRSYGYAKVTLGAAAKLHVDLLACIMNATTRFFDTTSAGRILNRLCKDVDEVDSQIPFVSEIFIQNGLYCFFAVIQIAIVFPWILIAVFVLVMVFLALSKCFRCGVRDFKRLENLTTSPVLSLAASTVNGLSTIHAYGKYTDLITRYEGFVDDNTFPIFCFHCAIRWLGVRLDFLTISLSVITALLVVLLPEGSVQPADAGLALSYCIQLSGLFQYSVRLALETEGRFTSVERVTEYIDKVPQEVDGKDVVEVNKEWPPEGQLELKDVVMRYNSSLPPALKGMSFVALPRERVGIVGRTGSGKSSIASALFRLVEIEGGAVYIDGQDIKNVPIRSLRSRLSIIPQDPVLFAGTLRYNLDPFDFYTDPEIWEALTRVNLGDAVSELGGGLEYMVETNGANFSVGERQLICMARALLRKSKILFMDEATASIDSRTDALLQDTIRTAFSNCTLLTVAHRLNTVLSYDKILVVGNGKALEYDTPAKLIAKSDSVFSQMLTASLNAAH